MNVTSARMSSTPWTISSPSGKSPAILPRFALEGTEVPVPFMSMRLPALVRGPCLREAYGVTLN